MFPRVWECFVSLSITVKELKALLPLLNYKALSSRALKDKFQVWVVDFGFFWGGFFGFFLVVATINATERGSNTEGAVCFHRRWFSALLLQEVGSKKDRLDFEQFHKLYNHIMFEQNEVSLKTDPLCALTKWMSPHNIHKYDSGGFPGCPQQRQSLFLQRKVS